MSIFCHMVLEWQTAFAIANFTISNIVKSITLAVKLIYRLYIVVRYIMKVTIPQMVVLVDLYIYTYSWCFNNHCFTGTVISACEIQKKLLVCYWFILLFRGQVCLVVNVASQWGMTKSNYQQLEQLYEKYSTKGLGILAFPCNQFASQVGDLNLQFIQSQWNLFEWYGTCRLT